MPAMIREPAVWPAQPVEKTIYIISNDFVAGEDLAEQVGHFGYQAAFLMDLEELENYQPGRRPSAILIDLHLAPDGAQADVFFNRLEPCTRLSIPLVFISDLATQEVRLKAVRAGGVAFYLRPVDMVSLINKLDELFSIENEEPARVLIVEDQEVVAAYYQSVIKMAGMSTRVTTNADDLLNRIEEYNPDLILMDLYMPGCGGIELSKMIRQMDRFVSTPIVFLSSEDDFSKQMEAMRVGGDDFLTKPIKASHLIALLRSRLDRLRSLRSFMVRDSLTGLLNHTAFFTSMAQEITRCKRQHAPLSMAMLDLDLFKLVNDRHGHSTGDSVLKSLSLILKQRLRKSDFIGRLGGEEFTIAMPDTPAESAVLVVDEIRAHFAGVNHLDLQREAFTVTFSAGVASFPDYSSFSALKEAADQALYRAKAAGRNRVYLAPPPKIQEMNHIWCDG